MFIRAFYSTPIFKRSISTRVCVWELSWYFRRSS